MADEENILAITDAPTASSKARAKQSSIELTEKLNELNKSFAVALYGNGVFVIKTDCQPIKYLAKAQFNDWLGNQYGLTDDEGKQVKIAPRWFGWSGRRQYNDVVFYPADLKNPKIYNLWRGFKYPAREGECGKFLKHIHDNICSGNKTYYEWLLDWMADCIQKPERKSWTAVLLMSEEEGTGKGFFAKHFGKLFGSHFMALNKPSQLIGRFNAHLEDKLVLFLDEGALVEKYAVDFVKSLITEPTLPVEGKGLPIREIQSFHRLVIATNDVHALKASAHDRRWMVLKVSPAAKNNLDYFKDIETELLNGGYEALFYFLSTRIYDPNTIKITPKTNALGMQKLLSLTGISKFWYECLESGMIGDHDLRRVSAMATSELPKAYYAWCDKMKEKDRVAESWLARLINQNCGAEFQSKPDGCGMRYYSSLPTLQEAREAFEKKLGQQIEWSEEV